MRRMIHAVQHRVLGVVGVSKSFIIEDQEVVLVDTGFSKGSARRIIGALNGLWKSPEEVGLYIITHRHTDHVGGLSLLKDTCKFKVAAHKDEAAPSPRRRAWRWTSRWTMEISFPNAAE